jgi:Predicted acyltransferases
MTVGGMFAWISCFSKAFMKKVKSQPKWVWVVLYSMVATIFLVSHSLFDHNIFLSAIYRLIVSLIFVMVIMEQNYASNSFYKMSDFRWVSKLGTYTYGLYCLHMIAILVVKQGLDKVGLNTKLWEVLGLEGLFSLAAAILIAMISYHLFEKKFLALKKKFTRIKSH